MAKKVAKKAAPLNTAALTGDPANPREISESAAAGLGYSIGEFGDLAGITYNLRTGELVAGHQRMGQIRQRWGDLAIEPLADDHGQIVTPAGVFPVRFVDWPKTKQRAANIAANSPEISGQFTDALFDQQAEIKAESPDLYDGLLFEGLLEDVAPVDDPLPDVTPPDTRTCTLRWRADQEPAIRTFLELAAADDMPAQLGVAILERIEAIATSG